MGFDIVHYNTHKTFSTPHGGGGPGAGPVGVTDALEPFLPAPIVGRRDDGTFFLDHDRPQSIGRLKGFHGNVGVLVRAYAFIRALGAEGLQEMSETAVLNANYLRVQLEDVMHLPYPRICKHEFVLSGKALRREHGVRVLDIAKRLIDYGIHPPTIYFPLLVEEALMIEPTETESKETLDRFVEAMREIIREATEQPGAAPRRAALGARAAAGRGEGGQAAGAAGGGRGALRHVRVPSSSRVLAWSAPAGRRTIEPCAHPPSSSGSSSCSGS
jgi:glycine dehydrogenase subunit 2